MSIRNSPQLSPQLLDAARCNARRSHGPCTAAGKENSKMNALQHGERSDPENHYEVMRALGEDPAQFEALKQELRDSFGAGDAFLDKQVDDLARLYWRRDRLERSQTGLMRRALLALEEQQHRRRKEIEGASFEVGQAINISMQAPTDPAARLRLLLSFLGVIRVQVHGRSFLAWQAAALQGFYGEKGGWRAARLGHLLSLFAEAAAGAPLVGAQADREGDAGTPVVAAQAEDEDDVGASLVGAEADGEGGHKACPYVATEPADELRYNELVLLLEDEMASVEEEFEYEEKLSEERAAIERDACLAPAGEEWKLMLRREETLDRSIDRKIKLLLNLRKAAPRTQKPQTLESRSAPDQDVETPANDVGAPLVGAQAHDECGPTNEQPSPEGRGCQAPAVSSAGA
jgi:hypothetical protein